jgi:ABC-2 type transporter
MSAPDIAIPDRGRLTLAETLADSRVMATRQLRKILRRPMYVVYLFVQPMIFVLLFRYVFGGAINTGRVSYVDYLMPGIIVMTAIFGALTTGLGLTEDMAAGVVDRFRSLPIARSAVLIGRTAADLATNLVSLIVMLLIGHLGLPARVRLLGVRPHRAHAQSRTHLRRHQPRHPRRQRCPRSDHRGRPHARPGTRNARLARRSVAGLRAPLRPRVAARVSGSPLRNRKPAGLVQLGRLEPGKPPTGWTS